MLSVVIGITHSVKWISANFTLPELSRWPNPWSILKLHHSRGLYPATQILTWFVQRWSVEVTFKEVRTQVGVETQRQWSDLAIARTTPTLLALFSMVTLMAHQLSQAQRLPVRTAAWYTKKQPTFTDALAWVRRHLWQSNTFSMSVAKTDQLKVPAALLERFTEALCYAA